MELFQKYKSLFEKYKVDNALRIAHFLAQAEHESGLKPISENLNYSAQRLLEVFPKYFSTVELAKKYERQPQKIASRVYANRMGNGDEASGDGWKFKGIGILQITGKDNFKLLTKDTGIDFLNNPDLLLEEPNAILSALWFWNKNNLNKYADKDDIKGLTKAINGGYNGLQHRTELLKKYKKLL